jgi:hypothetical protein
MGREGRGRHRPLPGKRSPGRLPYQSNKIGRLPRARPKRLVYLSSGMHRGGDPAGLNDPHKG